MAANARNAPASVLIDARALSSVAARSGTGTYVRNLLRALADPPQTDLVVNALVTAEVVVEPGVGRRSIHGPYTRPARAQVIEDAIRMPLEAYRWRGRGEVFHNPGFHAPLGIASPWVQTLHDLIPLVVDDAELEPLRKRWHRFGPRYRRADAVIAVSNHAAGEGIRLLGLDPKRIYVAPHGVDPSFHPAVPAVATAEPPYLLVVGEYSRRKGFAQAFAVIDALAEAGYPHVLKVAGQVHRPTGDQLDRLRAAAGRPERIELLGFVDDLPGLYRGGSALLMTSRYEGFGLPALEAMASGVPVVAFANSAVTEVVTGGGCLVPDGDVDAMVKAVRSILDSAEVAAEWREKGLERASRFTWAESAARHAEVYQSVAERRG